MKKEVKELAKAMIQAVLIAGAVCLFVVPLSCKITPEGVDIIGGDYNPPILKEITVLDNYSIRLDFSEPVKIKSSVVSPFIEDISDSFEHSFTSDLSPALAAATGQYGYLEAKLEYQNDNRNILYTLKESTVVGKKYEIYGVVEDYIGNSLTFCIPFTGFNSKVAGMIMTEIRSVPDTKNNMQEFIEFLVVNEGNLSGLKMKFSGGEKVDYDFPPVDVKKGDIIVLHTESGNSNCKDELGDDLTLSVHNDAYDNARDLWTGFTKGVLGTYDDVVVLYDKVNDFVMDALMYRNTATEKWSGPKQTLADFVADSCIYDSSDISNASIAKGEGAEVACAAKHTLQRQDINAIIEKLKSEDKLELPIKADSQSWKIVRGGYSPGRI